MDSCSMKPLSARPVMSRASGSRQTSSIGTNYSTSKTNGSPSFSTLHAKYHVSNNHYHGVHPTQHSCCSSARLQMDTSIPSSNMRNFIKCKQLIRLIKILPDVGNGLECNVIDAISLDDMKGRYSAVSCCVDDPNRTQEIHIHGMVLAVFFQSATL